MKAAGASSAAGSIRGRPAASSNIRGTKPGGLAPGIAFDLFSDIRYKTMVVRLNGDLAGEFATNLTIDGVSLGETHGLVAGLVHKVFSKLPIRLNVNINGPFRALIQMAKAFKDPTEVIAPVMPFPIDSPALKVEVLSTTKNEEQSTQPAPQTTTREPVTTTRRNEVTRPWTQSRTARGRRRRRGAADRLHQRQGAGQAD